MFISKFFTGRLNPFCCARISCSMHGLIFHQVILTCVWRKIQLRAEIYEQCPQCRLNLFLLVKLRANSLFSCNSVCCWIVISTIPPLLICFQFIRYRSSASLSTFTSSASMYPPPSRPTPPRLHHPQFAFCRLSISVLLFFTIWTVIRVTSSSA